MEVISGRCMAAGGVDCARYGEAANVFHLLTATLRMKLLFVRSYIKLTNGKLPTDLAKTFHWAVSCLRLLIAFQMHTELHVSAWHSPCCDSYQTCDGAAFTPTINSPLSRPTSFTVASMQPDEQICLSTEQLRISRPLLITFSIYLHTHPKSL